MGWPSVRSFKDGTDAITADVLNLPLNQLAERTEYLKQLIKKNDHTKVALVDAVVTDGGYGKPKKGQVVYRLPPTDNKDLSVYSAAKATDLGNGEWFYADQQASAVGVVSEVSGSKATVVLYGLIDFGESGIDASDVISDAVPVSGRYYLSSLDAGKMTASPVGPVIYVCDCQVFKRGSSYYVRSMVVGPQYRDTGESHIHRSFVLSGKPLGGYSVLTGGRFYAAGIVSDKEVKSTSAMPSGLVIKPCGNWTYSGTDTISYTLEFEANGAAGATGWAAYNLKWASSKDTSGSSVATVTNPIAVGSYGLQVRLEANSEEPSTVVGKKWTLNMPDAARAWLNYGTSSSEFRGFKLNLGMYPVLARYVPPLPENGSALTVDGIELRGPIFEGRKRWFVTRKDDNNDVGPWLVWVGGAETGVSATAPFIWDEDIDDQTTRDIVLWANRMRVGPTGFVTSLQPAPGAPFRITSAQTDADAVQGALQIAMDIDFTTSEGDVQGCQVVKAIEGSEFKTGPVVERIQAGPGLDVMPRSGQGTVTLSISNAVYAGDFETIALRNAKQDLAGNVFPYTKLLGWVKDGSSNIASGFTAKFRVPDHIKYQKYNVIVSASVFGEVDKTAQSIASFKLKNYILADHACSTDANPEAGVALNGSIASPTEGQETVIPVTFKPVGGKYTAFDPVLIHGFSDRTDSAHRLKIDGLLLKDDKTAHNPIVVYPGYFIGIDISRCATDGTEYTSPIGFLSLRWNLVQAE